MGVGGRGKPQQAAPSSERGPSMLPAQPLLWEQKALWTFKAKALGGRPAWAAAAMATGLVAGMAGDWKLSPSISQR